MKKGKPISKNGWPKINKKNVKRKQKPLDISLVIVYNEYNKAREEKTMSYTYYETMMEDYADLMEAVREDERECDRAWQATLRELMEG